MKKEKKPDGNIEEVSGVSKYRYTVRENQKRKLHNEGK